MRVLVACRYGHARADGAACPCAKCERDRERKRAWIAANPQRAKAHTDRWITANRSKRREIEKSWRARNPDKVAIHSARAGAKWSKQNKGKRNALTLKRKAALLKRIPAWADHSLIQELYETAALVSAETGVPHEVDHIIPLQGKAVSGLHVHTNLRVVERSVNRRKQNRLEI